MRTLSSKVFPNLERRRQFPFQITSLVSSQFLLLKGGFNSDASLNVDLSWMETIYATPSFQSPTGRGPWVIIIGVTPIKWVASRMTIRLMEKIQHDRR